MQFGLRRREFVMLLGGATFVPHTAETNRAGGSRNAMELPSMLAVWCIPAVNKSSFQDQAAAKPANQRRASAQALRT
jgi:hypothetical protein